MRRGFTKSENELENRFDKWLFVFKNLQKLHNRPKRLQERVFEKLFNIAEIAKFSPEEVQEYEESLMAYRDIKNSIDTAMVEAKVDVAEVMLKNGESDNKIILYTGLTL